MILHGWFAGTTIVAEKLTGWYSVIELCGSPAVHTSEVRTIYEHHKRAIEKIKSELQEDPEIIALVIGGSIAKGIERPDSDIDCYIVVTDERADQALKDSGVCYFNREVCDYEKGYVEGKIVSKDWLRKAAEYGNEATRWAFVKAWVEFTSDEEVSDLIELIARYPRDEKEERITGFLAQYQGHKWFCNEAFRREDSYLLAYAISNLVLFSGRMILAHNEMLYPFHKWFLHELESAPDKPAELMSAIHGLLDSRDEPGFEAYVECIESWDSFPQVKVKWVNKFVLDSEWNWLDPKMPVTDI
ncbi:nucleotidyltransferase domain-containing protein [Candidatus Hydrogenedentota bacterium]